MSGATPPAGAPLAGPVTMVTQICPRIERGTGVAGVAYHLEREFAARGVATSRVTLSDTRGAWTLQIPGRLGLAVQAVWFSTVGTIIGRRLLRQRPGLSICHNDALVGDVYVNHGVVHAAMQARGATWLRMVRNPLHLFTFARDRARYRSRHIHRLIVNLSDEGGRELVRAYGRVRPAQTVIGNGVDLVAFDRLSASERAAARDRAGLGSDDFAVLFIGHEYDRKGLPQLIEAVGSLADERVHLFVLGGTPEMIEAQRGTTAATALGSRLHFAGVDSPRPWLDIADALTLPSAYEASSLVVLEALACGVPVVATPTGTVPELVRDGVNGYLTTAEPASIARAIARIQHGDRDAFSGAARSEALQHSWTAVTERYLEALARLPTQPSHPSRRPPLSDGPA